MSEYTKLEFLVRMTCQSCVESVRNVLQDVPGIKSLGVDLGAEQVVVETNLSTCKVQELLESTGKLVVLQGVGNSTGQNHLGAAVVELGVRVASKVKGVVRLAQLNEDTCLIDGTIDGLEPGKHSLYVHELGDLSSGCQSCGDIFKGMSEAANPQTGDLGTITADDSGRAELRTTTNQFKIWEIIGRSMVVHEGTTPDSNTNRLCCGIVARSAGVFQNPKRLCQCDGVSVWDERNVPVAGESRQKQAAS